MLKMLDPEEDFSEEVKRFVACSLIYNGIFYAPGDLDFAQWYLRRPYYECKECGNVEDLLFEHDGICDGCQKEYFSSITGKVKEGAKKTTEIKYRHDEGPVRKKFQAVATKWDSFYPDDDDPVDVQVCRIAAALEYKAVKDAQFLEQKGALDL